MSFQMQIPNADELKLQFAAALLRFPSDAFKAACEVFGADTGRALYAASNWLQDPAVIEEKARLIEEDGELAFLPSKAELARKVYDLATDEEKRIDFRDRIEALKFYASLRNFIEKPKEGSGDTNNTNVVNNVMIVKDHGSNDEWSSKLRDQQRKLMENASKPH